MKVNLQKFISSSGHCSRRKAGDLIKEKKVKVNGKLAELGMKADENDKVEIFDNGSKIILNYSPAKDNHFIYIKLNKPVGYICTNKKFKNEKNIFDLLPKNFNATAGRFGDVAEPTRCAPTFKIARLDASHCWHATRKRSAEFILPTPSPQNTNRLFTAGRLDKDSHGLVLLTNDGDLVQKLTHPSFEHEKEYIVSIYLPLSQRGIKGDFNENPPTPLCERGEYKVFRNSQHNNIKTILEKFKSGINIPDGFVKAKEIKYLKNNKFSIILTTGKKRQIREMFKKLGYEVEDLQRVRIGNLRLGNLKEGDFELLSGREIEDLTILTDIQ